MGCVCESIVLAAGISCVLICDKLLYTGCSKDYNTLALATTSDAGLCSGTYNAKNENDQDCAPTYKTMIFNTVC